MKRTYKHIGSFLLFLAMPLFSFAQMSINVQTAASLPPAPMPQSSPTQTSSGPTANALQPPAPQTPGTPMSLTLKEAEALAMKNNPQISVGRLLALASVQVTREVKSNLWPTATGDLTGVDAQSGSRITAGALNNPIIYERAAAGLMVTQLITDFGRTTNLISSANYAAKAENQNAMATKEQILLAVNRAFYNALQAHAVVTVAQQTVSERQTVANQVEALFKSKLKSELDFSFASVNLAQAKLLLLDAQNSENAAFATLSMVLGFPSLQDFQLVEEPSPQTPPPGNVDDLISQAFSDRPEILSLQFQYQSARKFQTAERDLALSQHSRHGSCGGHARGKCRGGSQSQRFEQHVWGCRRRHRDSSLQRLPIYREGPRGNPESASNSRAASRHAQFDLARRAHELAECEHCLSAIVGYTAIVAAGQPGSESCAIPLQPGARFHC